MKLSKLIVVCLGAVALLSATARAVPINGSIGFDGTGVGMVSGPTSTLTFNNPMTVGARIGDYLNVVNSPLQNVNFAPISWTGTGSSAVLTSSNSPEWSFVNNGTTYSFNLLALTNASLTAGTVSLSGTGVAFISGVVNRDPTFATFSVQGTGTSFNFTIIQASNTGTGQGVPEGGAAITLLGIGVMGLGVLRKVVRR